MIVRNVAFTGLLLLAASAMAAESAFPQKMEGRWGQSNNKAEVELVQMESPTKAKLNVIFWDGCTRRGEISAELKEGAWTFVAPGGVRCENITVTITPISGKNRFEGTYETVWRSSVSKGNVYLEW